MQLASTRGTALAVFALLALLALCVAGRPVELPAQATVRPVHARVGSEEERYLRALASRSSEPVSWSMRPVDAAAIMRSLAGAESPWTLQPGAPASQRFTGAWAEYTMNTGLPSSRPDGPAWSGRGSNLRAGAAFTSRRGILRVWVAPEAWVAQNASFALVPTAGAYAYSDPATPISIDLPQRMGDTRLARLEPGESSVALEWTRVRLALTSQATRLGPGTDHSLVLQGDGGGIPRIELGTARPVRTRVGSFAARVAWGRSAQTSWAPEQGTGALFTSFLIGTWRPLSGDRVELGAMRLFHRAWADISARELLIPFGSVYRSKWAGGSDSAADNQLASVFARVRVPEAGLEFFGEFGKNDRSRSLREQALELEHNSAWLVGAQKTWYDERRRLWALNVNAASGAISHIARFRGQAWFYEHSPLRQGHTLRGQLLGTPLLQREGGGELRLDRYGPAGRDGIIVVTRALPNERSEFVDPSNVRQEWSVMLERMRSTGRGHWRARIGAVADLGYSRGRDIYSLHLSLAHSMQR